MSFLTDETTPIILNAAAKSAVDNYLKELADKNSERRHKQILQITAVATLLLAILGTILAWALTELRAGLTLTATQTARDTANNEVRRMLTTDTTILQNIQDDITKAKHDTVEALAAANSAHLAMRTAEEEFKNRTKALDLTLNITKNTDQIAENPVFQDAVKEKVIKQIQDKIPTPSSIIQSMQFIVRSSGLGPPDAFSRCQENEILIGGSCINRIPTLPQLSNQVGIGPVFTTVNSPITEIRCQRYTGDGSLYVEAFAICLRIKDRP